MEVLGKYSRISNFFSNANGKYLKEKFKEIKRAVEVAQKELNNPELFEDTSKLKPLEKITEEILPKDDGSFYFSEVRTRLDIGIDTALGDMFERYIHKHFSEGNSYSTDEKVWKDIYKTYFDKYDLSSKLTTHTVETEDDTFEFERAWKNGVWNIYEPISFNLKDAQNIKNKVYKWAGKIAELSNTKEGISLNFLSTMPPKEELQKFIKSKLSNKKQSLLQINIISEKEAEEFIGNGKSKMLSSH